MLPTKKIIVTSEPIGGTVDVHDACTPRGLAWHGHKLMSNEGATTQSPVLQIKGGMSFVRTAPRTEMLVTSVWEM